MSDPFTQPAPKGAPAYWVRDPDPAAERRHRELLSAAERIHGAKTAAKYAGNPLARTWHDSS